VNGPAEQAGRAPRFPRPAIMLVTDRRRAEAGDLAHLVARAVAGGIRLVQIREKDLPARELHQAVVACRAAVEEAAPGREVLIVVNDRLDVALAAGADGVHLTAWSLSPGQLRGLVPPGFLVGCSVHSRPAAVRAAGEGANYLLFGHVFPTRSKPGVPARGLDLLRLVAGAVDCPVLAIGGVNARRLSDVAAAGCDGAAVMSLLMGARDPAAAARELVQAANRCWGVE